MKYTFSECNFVDSFINNISFKKILGKKSLIFDEVETSYGIPDLISIDKKEYESVKRFFLKYQRINLTNGHAKIISKLIDNGALSEQKLIEETGLRPDHFKKSKKILEEMGVVYENKNKFFLKKSFNIPKVNFWSFEFKLTNWKIALRQSLRNRAFSSCTVVVMPMDKKDILIKNKKAFEQFNVGIIVYDFENRIFETISKPNSSCAISFTSYIDTLGRLANQKGLINFC